MKNIRKYIIIFLNILLIILIGMIRDRYRLGAFSFSVIPLIGGIVFVCNNEVKLYETYKRNISVFFSSILFIAMLSIEQIIRMLRQMDNEPIHFVFKVCYLPVLFINVYICMAGVYQLFLKEKRRCNSSKSKTILGLYRPTWIVAVVTIFFSLAYFPGEVGNDLIAILNDISMGVWNDWHTVSFMMLIKICSMGTQRVFGVTVVQAIFFILVQNYAIGYLYKRFSSSYSKIPYYYALLSVTLGLTAYRYIPSICKDVTFFEAIFAFSISILCYVQREHAEKKDYIYMFLFGLIASLFRHSMIIVVMITMMIVGAYGFAIKRQQQNHKALLVVIFSIFTGYFLVTQILAFGILQAKPNPSYVKYSIPMNLIASMAYRYEEGVENIDEEDIRMMEEILPLDQWAKCYSPYDCDPVAREYGQIGENILKLNNPRIAQNVLKLNFHFLCANTKSYVISLFDANSLVWEIASPVDGMEYIPTGAIDFIEVHHMRKGDFFYFSENLIDYLASNPISNAIFFRGGMSTFSLIVVEMIFIMKRRRKEMLAILPMNIYLILLLFSIPQPQARYIFPITQYAIFFGIYIYYEKSIMIKGESE